MYCNCLVCIIVTTTSKNSTLTFREYHGFMKQNFNFADATNRMTRFRLRLLDFDCEVVLCVEVKHQVAVALFRLTITENS